MIGSRQLVQLATCLSKVKYISQTAMTSLLVPPCSVRGQKKLDYEAFNVKVQGVPCLLLPRQHVNRVKSFLLKLPHFKPVKSHKELKDQLIIYLDPRKVENITYGLKKELDWNNNCKKKELEFSYENWPSDEVLRAILPENVEVPTSFSQVGHIVHLNLRDEQLPYKHVIGQVYLDKIPWARTVVNKLDNIDNTYRSFAMEVLCGEPNTIVTHKESGYTYQFDFSKVYWNSRLSTEHNALVKLIDKGDVLYDVFAGVGPFAIPATRKGVRVLANDLNPHSYKWLLNNAKTNKVDKSLTAFNKDGRDFLRDEVKKDILDRRLANASGSEHVAMNLPALAIEFFDVFPDWFSAEDIENVCSKPPTIHLYCFIKAKKDDDFKIITKKLLEEKLGPTFSTEALINIHHVRNVSPSKEMMRISFSLTREMLKGEEPAKKRFKLTDSNTDSNFPGKNNGEE